MLSEITTAGVHVFGGPRVTDPGAARALEQLVSAALLPGVAGEVIGLPELREGQAFPTGAVAAFDARAGGVLVPGLVGPELHCGVRLLRSDLDAARVGTGEAVRSALAAQLRAAGPRLDALQLCAVLQHGAGGAIARGLGVPADVDAVPGRGCLPLADARQLSARALARGAGQLGTLGGGDFISFVRVGAIAHPAAAAALGLVEGTLAVLLHADARALGYQVSDEAVELLLRASERYRIRLPDRQLACAPLASEEARRCLGALAAAGNFAFANRQALTHRVRQALGAVLGVGTDALGLTVACDVPHNSASFEEHRIEGRSARVCVHRRGAARALRAGHAELPRPHRTIGSPVVLLGAPHDPAHLVVPLEGSGAAFDSLPHRASLGALADARLARPVAALHPIGWISGADIDRVGGS